MGRATTLRTLLATISLAAAAGLFAAPAMATSGVKCANSSSYGSSCINLHGTGLRLDDIQAYFTPPNNDYFSQQTWAFRLTTYGCDPIGKTEHQCRPVGTHYSRLRHGNPPQAGQQCLTIGGQNLAYQQCQSYGMAYADANVRDWPKFKVPHRYRFDHWMCVDVATLRHGHWHRNGEPHTPGVRGCAEVKG